MNAEVKQGMVVSEQIEELAHEIWHKFIEIEDVLDRYALEVEYNENLAFKLAQAKNDLNGMINKIERLLITIREKAEKI